MLRKLKVGKKFAKLSKISYYHFYVNDGTKDKLITYWSSALICNAILAS